MGFRNIFTNYGHKLKGTECVSMIVDIQNPYLPPERSWQCKEYIFSRRRLVKILLEDIELNMDEWNDIVLVEYTMVSWTIKEIKEKLKKYPQAITLKKDSDGLLRSSSRIKEKALKKLEPIKDSRINIKWVSVSCCVRQTASSLLNYWFIPNVIVSNSLNVIGTDIEDKKNFIKRNTVWFIKETYEYDKINEYDSKRNISHILDYWRTELDLDLPIWEL